MIDSVKYTIYRKYSFSITHQLPLGMKIKETNQRNPIIKINEYKSDKYIDTFSLASLEINPRSYLLFTNYESGKYASISISAQDIYLLINILYIMRTYIAGDKFDDVYYIENDKLLIKTNNDNRLEIIGNFNKSIILEPTVVKRNIDDKEINVSGVNIYLNSFDSVITLDSNEYLNLYYIIKKFNIQLSEQNLILMYLNSQNNNNNNNVLKRR